MPPKWSPWLPSKVRICSIRTPRIECCAAISARCAWSKYWETFVHKALVLWFTALSGAEKSTFSNLTDPRLRAAGAKVELLDGDVVRTHLSKGLGFSKDDRDINIRRIGFVSEL